MMTILIIMMTCTAVIVVAGTLMQKIKIEDKKDGLDINDREYSIRYTLIRLFRKQDERIVKETAMTYADYIKENKSWLRKSTWFVTIGAMLITAAALILICIFKTNELYLAIASLILLLLSGMTYSIAWPVILVFFIGFAMQTWFCILIMFAAIVEAVYMIRIRISFQKNHS